jgi:hypothetical protein
VITGIDDLVVGGVHFNVTFSSTPEPTPFLFSYDAAAAGQPLTGVDAGIALNEFYAAQQVPGYAEGPGIFARVAGVGDEVVFFLTTGYGPSSTGLTGHTYVDFTEPLLGLPNSVISTLDVTGNSVCVDVCIVWTPVPAVPMSKAACNGIYNGTFSGNITVSAGQTCEFFGGSITGNITVRGGTLVLNNMSVAQNVRVDGGGTVLLGPSLTIQGNLQIQNLPVDATQNLICGVSVSGDLQYHNNGTAVQVGSASPACAGNVVGGNLQVTNNTALAQVFDNTVTGNLQCHNNTSSITGGGNTATQKQGQCSSF